MKVFKNFLLCLLMAGLVVAEVFPPNQIVKTTISMLTPTCMAEGPDSCLLIGGVNTAGAGKIIKCNPETGAVLKEFSFPNKEIRSAENDSAGNPIFAGNEIYYIVGDSIVDTISAPNGSRIQSIRRVSNKFYVSSGPVHSSPDLINFIDSKLGAGLNSYDMAIGDGLPWVTGSNQPFVAHLKSDGNWTVHDTSRSDFRQLVQISESSCKKILRILVNGDEVFVFGVKLCIKLNSTGVWENVWTTDGAIKSAEWDNDNSKLAWISNYSQEKICLLNIEAGSVVKDYGCKENGFPSGDPMMISAIVYPSRVNKNIIYSASKNFLAIYNKDGTGIAPKKINLVKRVPGQFGQTIYNVRGQEILSSSQSSSFKSLSKGVYFTKLPDGSMRAHIIR